MTSLALAAFVAFAAANEPGLLVNVPVVNVPVVNIPVGQTRMVALPATEAGIKAMLAGADGRAVIVGEPLFSGQAGRVFVRIKGIAPGTATVSVGAAQARVVVEPATVLASPTIFEPASGAAVWGKFALGAELPGDWAGKAAKVRVDDGKGNVKEFATESLTAAGWGPTRRAAFAIDSGAFTGDVLQITPVLVNGAGKESAGRTIAVRRMTPAEGAIDAREAENVADGPRPKRFPRGPAQIGMDPACSGGKFFSNYSPDPAICLPLVVKTPGVYQVIATVGGTSAGGALPTVSVIVDDQEYGATSARLVQPEWHRLAIGTPIALPAGDHILTLHFENDFYVEGKADRNLKTDKIEIVRIADAGSSVAEAGGEDGGAMSGSMMAMGAMNAMGGVGGMGMSGMSGSGAAGSDDMWGTQPAALRVAMLDLLDGMPIGGQTNIHGRCWWPTMSRADEAPEVMLLVNGSAVAVQKALAPAFLLDPAALKPGENTVQFVATLGGSTVKTAVQRIRNDAPAAKEAEPFEVHRFSVRADGWSAESRKLIRKGDGEEQACAFMMTDGFIEVDLPPALSGQFEVFLDGRGEAFEGNPIAAVSVVTGNPAPAEPAPTDGDKPKDKAQAEIDPWWGVHRICETAITQGPKRLRVSFINDKCVPGKGDRNLMVTAVSLRTVAKTKDITPPSLKVLYPPADKVTDIYREGVVILEAADDRFVQAAEVLVDGADIGLGHWTERESGLIMLPLPARRFESGPHTLTVRVRDAAGNMTSGPDLKINVLGSPSKEPLIYERAVTLLNRLGFGPDRRELAMILTDGEEAWLRSRLWAAAESPGEQAAMDEARLFYVEVGSDYHVRGRTLSHAISTPNPVRAHFVLWAQNHFSTWINKTEGKRKWQEHVAFSKIGPAPFFDLLYTSASSPAMLKYLDQEQSFAGKLNENYAREIMELHTLGVRGGYTQQDVTTLARILTGWSAAVEADGPFGGRMDGSTFRYDPTLADGTEATFLGATFPKAERAERFDRVRLALEMLAAHPSTSRFICTKLAAHYVSAPPDEALVADLASVFDATGGDLREVMVAMARHPMFWNAPQRMIHPTEFALRMLRTTNTFNPWMCHDFLQRSGCGLFDRATPDGYPQTDASYADSNSMVQRWRFGTDLRWPIRNLSINRLNWGGADKLEGWADMVTDSIAIGLTGRALGDASHQAAIEALKNLEGNPDERVLNIGTFISRLPEINLR